MAFHTYDDISMPDPYIVPLKVGLPNSAMTKIAAFMDDSAEVLVPELNYEGQFANLVSGTLGRPVHRLNRVTGTPMNVADILKEVHRLAGRNELMAAE